jgi:hypothetical protein
MVAFVSRGGDYRISTTSGELPKAVATALLEIAAVSGYDPMHGEQVRQWRAEGRLPFRDFSVEQMQRMRGSLIYPPPGSTGAPRKTSPERPAPEDTLAAQGASDRDPTAKGSPQ